MGRAYSNRFSVTVVAATGPTWYSSASPVAGQVVEISGTSPSTLTYTAYSNTNSGNQIDTWTGLGIHLTTGRVGNFAGGGHADCFSNAIPTITMLDNAPSWRLSLNDSPITAIPLQGTAGANSSPYYVDGRPASCHTYSCVHVIGNKLMRFGATAIANNANSTPTIDGFDLTTDTLDAAGTYPNISPNPGSGGGTGWATTKDSSTNDIYILIGNQSLLKRAADDTRTTMGGGFPTIDGFLYASAFDTTRRQILYIYGSSAALYNVSTPGWSTPTFTGAGAAALLALDYGIGLIYDDVLDAYLGRGGAAGQTLYKLVQSSPGTFTVTTITLTGASLPAVATVTSGENVHTKFMNAPTSLGGYFYFPRFSANGFFIKRPS